MPDKRYLSRRDIEYRKKLYTQGLDDNQIAQKIGISIGGIFAWRKRNNLQANKKQGGQIIELDFKPSWELGYLIGLTVGDGAVCKNGRSYQTRFASTRKEFIELIVKTVNKLFPQLCTTCCSFYTNNTGKFPNGGYRKPTMNYAVSISSKELHDFMKQYKKENYFWLTPDEQPLIIKYGFIGGIIDAEGSISRPCVRIYSKPRENLVRLKKLLLELNFIYGKLSIKKQRNIHVLSIYGRRNHRLLLETAKIPYKRKKLEKYMVRETYYHKAEEYWAVMKLRNEGLGERKIAKKTGLPVGTVSNWLYNGVMPLSLGLAQKYGSECSDV